MNWNETAAETAEDDSHPNRRCYTIAQHRVHPIPIQHLVCPIRISISEIFKDMA